MCPVAPAYPFGLDAETLHALLVAGVSLANALTAYLVWRSHHNGKPSP